MFFNHIWGKTLRDGDQNVFGVRRNPHTTISPIRGIEQYMDVARQMKVDLTRGSSLETLLGHMGSDEGETLHCFRAGCAIPLALTGADLPEIMQHVRWARHHTALHYMQLAKVLHPEGASACLASGNAGNVVNPWQDVNHLQRFVSAFPTNITNIS
ncbi:LIGHT-DEPENDENT SHORT HYPOCOTYLS 6 [Paramuricea clavata]|uniref:LIGHT-DEPENDENT SHORT HYPOCOTYLS 6 n=1 Tax=Paramuricea clavata TaxID=317549 RepID=A0A6S7FKT6_PARCT|nr:LIGHT-DEPENDENT SHORT HYPOCOTYLS 6 [Paramuricea clavata]